MYAHIGNVNIERDTDLARATGAIAEAIRHARTWSDIMRLVDALQNVQREHRALADEAEAHRKAEAQRQMSSASDALQQAQLGQLAQSTSRPYGYGLPGNGVK